LVEANHAQLSIRRQCELLGLDRSICYYEPATETIENLRLMRRIDEQCLKTPFIGGRRMAIWPAREGGRWP
jgi:putative transposase